MDYIYDRAVDEGAFAMKYKPEGEKTLWMMQHNVYPYDIPMLWERIGNSFFTMMMYAKKRADHPLVNSRRRQIQRDLIRIAILKKLEAVN